MRTTVSLSVATTATLMALSCSSGGPTLCAESQAIPQQTVNVGEEETVAVCFEDPGGGALSYSASSSDGSVVDAFTRGSNVIVRGVSPGQTTVTATATNEADLSESVEFQVLSVNLPPFFTDSVTEDAVGVGRVGMWDLYTLFEEPSGEEMTFEATSDFPGLTVSLTDSAVWFTGVSDGQAQVTLTATDPHGDEGSGTIAVTVWEPEVVFVDEFDSDASLDDWEAASDDTELEIVNGSLVVRSLAPGFYGIAERSGEDVDEYYLDITTRVEAEGQTGSIWFVNSDEAYRLILWDIGGSDVNWRFHRWGGEDGWLEVDEGNSSLVSLDRYRTYSILMYDQGMQILVDDQVAVNVTFTDFTANTTMAGLWLIGTEEGTEYDHAQLRGRPGSTSDRHHDTADRERELERKLPDERMLVLPPLSGQH